MAREPIAERIQFDSPPEAVFQSFRRYAFQAGIDVPAMPIYDLGRLLNIGAPEYIGDDRLKFIIDSYRELTGQIGVRLPQHACAFLNRYVSDEEFFFLGVGTDDGTDTTTTWFQWSRRDGWDQMMTQTWRGRGSTFERGVHYTTTIRDPENLGLLLGTLTTTLFGNLYLIYERGGAVETEERPPASTRGQTGRMRVHPMAPSSVISIRVNDPRLLRPSEPPTQPTGFEPHTIPTEPHEPVQRRPARGTTVHYRHPRYVNKQGRTGHRRAQHGHPDSDQPSPPPTYKAEDN